MLLYEHERTWKQDIRKDPAEKASQSMKVNSIRKDTAKRQPENEHEHNLKQSVKQDAACREHVENWKEKKRCQKRPIKGSQSVNMNRS